MPFPERLKDSQIHGPVRTQLTTVFTNVTNNIFLLLMKIGLVKQGICCNSWSQIAISYFWLFSFFTNYLIRIFANFHFFVFTYIKVLLNKRISIFRSCLGDFCHFVTIIECSTKPRWSRSITLHGLLLQSKYFKHRMCVAGCNFRNRALCRTVY